MKKTQKVLDCLTYIDNKNLHNYELIRLKDEIDSLITTKLC